MDTATISENIFRGAKLVIAAIVLFTLLDVITDPDFETENVVVVSILSGIIGSATALLFAETFKK